MLTESDYSQEDEVKVVKIPLVDHDLSLQSPQFLMVGEHLFILSRENHRPFRVIHLSRSWLARPSSSETKLRAKERWDSSQQAIL